MSHAPLAADEPVDAYRRYWHAMVDMLRAGRSFSGRERNCCFLNVGGGSFADVSAVTGLDFPDDGRTVAAVDWDFDGDLDVWQLNRNAPRLRFLRNDIEAGHRFLALRLVGTTANRDAIGARVEIVARGLPGGQLVKSLCAGDGFQTQSTKWLHFGLGNCESVQQVSVRWPGGATETFSGCTADGFFTLTQGEGQARPFAPPRNTVEPLADSRIELPERPAYLRVGLAGRTPPPSIRYKTWQGERTSLHFPRRRPLLVNLWAQWCLPCVKELGEMTRRADELRAAGVDVLALTIDGVQNAEAPELSRARELLEQMRFPFDSGRAAFETVDKLTHLQRPFVEAKLNTLPTSLLISPSGSLEAIYKGPLDIDVLLVDARRVAAAPDGADLSVAFPGRWHARPTVGKRDELITLGSHLLVAGYLDDAEMYYQEALRIDGESKLARSNLALVGAKREQLEQRIRDYEQRLSRDASAENHFNLAVYLNRAHRESEALVHYRQAAQLSPNSAQVRVSLARLLAREGELTEAEEHARHAFRIEPDGPSARQLLQEIETGVEPNGNRK